MASASGPCAYFLPSNWDVLGHINTASKAVRRLRQTDGDSLCGMPGVPSCPGKHKPESDGGSQMIGPHSCTNKSDMDRIYIDVTAV